MSENTQQPQNEATDAVSKENVTLSKQIMNDFIKLYSIGSGVAIPADDKYLFTAATKIDANNTRELSARNNHQRTHLQIGKALFEDKEQLTEWMALSVPSVKVSNPNR